VAAWTVWRRYRRVTVLLQPAGARAIRVRTPFVFVGNNVYQLSGVNFGSRARLDGGRLHLCMAPELDAAGVVRVLGEVLVGRLESVQRFESRETTAATINTWRPQLGVALDGEVMVLPTPLRFRIRPGALRVIVPRVGD
jgi:diacylglycerol kinase family enzyme